MEAPELHHTKATDIAFRDPLSEETRKLRTNLLFTSALSIIVKTYDLKLSKAPWLEFDIPTDAPQVLDGALSAVLCYLLFVFVLYAWQDFRRWRLAGDIHLVYTSLDLILKSRSDLFAISQHLPNLTCGKELSEGIQEAVGKAAKQLPDSMESIRALTTSLHRLNALQWFRVIAIEMLLPIVLGAFALAKVSPALLPFLAAALA